MSLNSIKGFKELDKFRCENNVNLRCRKTGLFLRHSEPIEGAMLFLVLEDGSLVEMAAHQLEETFEIVPSAKRK
ncbi:hypothetical protein ACH0BF_00110 [Pseudobacillus sp. 179-B 2D1 NHS]|uniref:hypothetical protein n=1 Tax=Pseudobacillus sp. 179-B 2D1 NHS TaxID=3374292 RepID=UPI000E763ABC|nr:hypothetical protein CJ483_03200 [Bacillus sp. PK3_68]